MLDPFDLLPPTPLAEWEIMAIASRMIQRVDCDQFIAERMERQAPPGDAIGVATWHALAANVRAIRDAPVV